ncbi:dephospho-CoA kinase [Batrachochytrium salamandrivorans]|nr:dephospho-CoA kinase [Batrachochytrium salamandrivorans]
MRIVGLTGGIACGKSLVTSELLDRGIPVLDCDLIARIVVEPNTVCREQIVFAFKEDLLAMGEEIELPDGSLNRKALGKLVFADEQKRQLLTKITGTGIFNYLLSRFVWHFLRGTPMLVVDAPTFHCGYGLVV